MTIQTPNSFRTGPDERGHFGLFGGRFVAETLMPLDPGAGGGLRRAKADPAFQAEMASYLDSIMSAGRARSISPSA